MDIVQQIFEPFDAVSIYNLSTNRKIDFIFEFFDINIDKRWNYSIVCQLNLPKQDTNEDRVEKLLHPNINETPNGHTSKPIMISMINNWKVKMLHKTAPGFLTIDFSPTLPSQNQHFKTYIISGIITDTTNSPIRGTVIIVKGTKIGTISDIEGNFSLEIPVNSKILGFSYPGMKYLEVEIRDQTRFAITLRRDPTVKKIIRVGICSGCDIKN